jgi:lysophospholipase L1-like esterase
MREAAPRYLYFSELARLLEARFGYTGITPVQEGRGGWTAAQAKTILGEVLEGVGAGDLLVLEFGANDLSRAGGSVEGWLGDLRALVAVARTKTSQVLVLTPTMGGAMPRLAGTIRRGIRGFARREQVAYADITHWSLYRGEKFAWAYLANEYHPSFAGHRTIADLLLPLFTAEHFDWPSGRPTT